MNSSNYNGIISEDEYFEFLPEYFFSPDDYKGEIESAVGLTKGVLVLEEFVGRIKDDQFELLLKLNGKIETINISTRKYFDIEIFNRLNEIVKRDSPDCDKMFVDISETELCCIAFITKKQEVELFKEGLIYRSEEFKYENGLIPLTQEFQPPYMNFTDDELYKEYKSIRAIKDWEKEHSWHIMHLEKEFKKRHLMIPMGKEQFRELLLFLAVIVSITSIVYFIVKLIF
jgi:hypothetical protein